MGSAPHVQLELFPYMDGKSFQEVSPATTDLRKVMSTLLEGDLDFRGVQSTYASHGLHPFAAKFPPQIPRVFIQSLTQKGAVVLDPMVGSGTTAVEAIMLGRKSIGVDIDPLAVRLTSVKTKRLDEGRLRHLGRKILLKANRLAENVTLSGFDAKTRAFVDYWFPESSQRELLALAKTIGELEDPAEKRFFEVTFSATIIAKSGSVSFAKDLSHSRPHRDLHKRIKSPLSQFAYRLEKNIKRVTELPADGNGVVLRGDARRLPLQSDSVDLVVTSPPYANAIDYMRAHKFSLIWFGYSIDELSQMRAEYIGAERTRDFIPVPMPEGVEEVLSKLRGLDQKKARILRKYFAEMEQVLREMARVLSPGRAAVVVVGSSTIKGMDVQTHTSVIEIAKSVGFDVVGIARRNLDRDRRMMPVSFESGEPSGIERRMHQEFVIGLMKPGE